MKQILGLQACLSKYWMEISKLPVSKSDTAVLLRNRYNLHQIETNAKWSSTWMICYRRCWKAEEIQWGGPKTPRPISKRPLLLKNYQKKHAKLRRATLSFPSKSERIPSRWIWERSDSWREQFSPVPWVRRAGRSPNIRKIARVRTSKSIPLTIKTVRRVI